jgi:hypothetical protein
MEVNVSVASKNCLGQLALHRVQIEIQSSQMLGHHGGEIPPHLVKMDAVHWIVPWSVRSGGSIFPVPYEAGEQTRLALHCGYRKTVLQRE